MRKYFGTDGIRGDGVLTSVKLVEAIRDSGKSLDELVGEIVDWPQLLINVRVDNSKKNLWNKNEVIVKFIEEKELEMATVEKVAKEIAAVVEKELI